METVGGTVVVVGTEMFPDLYTWKQWDIKAI